jgi:6-phosphogluconate dehydrogenase
MQLGMIGLGRMGAGMTRRLMRGGHQVVGMNRDEERTKLLEKEGMVAAFSLRELVDTLTPPRAVWLSLPAGAVTEGVIDELAPLLAAGDVIVDSGNTNWHDDQRRADALKEHGIHYVDQGTSGGVWGLEVGFSLMVGGEPEIVKRLEPAFLTLAPENGYGHVGPVGAGHFVKMVHNGVEYGLMQAYAEGFEIMRAAEQFNLDMHQISGIWNHGSVVRSWLLELAEQAFAQDPNLDALKGYVEDSGEGRWTVQAAIDFDVPAPIITLSLMQRFVSRQDESFAAKVLAALRNQFGGHAVKSQG